MTNNPPKIENINVPGTNHYFGNADLSLFSQAGAFGMWKAWYRAGLEEVTATYDLLIRDMPDNRNFLVFTGLEEVLTDLLNWKFTDDDIERLIQAKLIDEEMAQKLKIFKFEGDVLAMKEGSVFFPGEPVMRLTGPLWQLELLYLYIVNAISSNTIFSSKCVRSILVAQGKIVVLPTTRAQGFESGFKCMRSLYIVGGSPSSSQLAFWRKYGLTLPKKILNALTHAFIKSFDSELEAMRSFTHTFSDDEAVILVDTYNFKNGVNNFITVAKELKEKGGKIAMMYIDSGNLVQRSKYARKELDKNGLHDIKILLSGNIEEKMIEKMLKSGAMCDGFLVVTELISSPDAPKLEVVYKLAEIQKGQDIRPVMKLSKGKKSYPAKKQVFRLRDEQGIMVEDVIGLENEKINGQLLLEEFVSNGKLINYLPPLEEIRSYCKKEIDGLPSYLKILRKSKNYPVNYSEALSKLSAETEKKMH